VPSENEPSGFILTTIFWISAGAATYDTFDVQRHFILAKTHRTFRASAMQTWREVAGRQLPKLVLCVKFAGGTVDVVNSINRAPVTAAT
jgi:hypothetical protein